MKSQKGSVTVIALIMLLFLVILCGGWIMMMTQEKTNALADSKQQQAWYAAEAGYKRAAILLGQKEENWNWTNNDVSTFNKSVFNRKVDMKTLEVNDVNLKDTVDNPWYAVNVAEITTDKYESYPTTSGDSKTYAVTSVGEYMGERKIIKRTVKVIASSTNPDTPPITPTTPSSLVGPGLVQAGGTVAIYKDGVNVVTGDIYVNSKTDVIDTHGNETDRANTAKGIIEDPTTVGALKTHVPDKYFTTANYNLTTLEYVADDTATGTAANNSSIKVKNGTPLYMEWPIQFKAINYYKWDTGEPVYQTGTWNNTIVGENDSTLFIHITNGTTLRMDKGIQGPTTGKPITLIFDGDVTLDAELSGNIMILSKGTITIPSRNTISGMIFVVSNGSINWGPIVKYATLSSDNDVTILKSAPHFYGQIVAKHNVSLYGSQIIYDNSMSTSGWFSYPDGMQ